MDAIVQVENIAATASVQAPEIAITEESPVPNVSTWVGNVMQRRIGSVPNGPNTVWYAQ